MRADYYNHDKRGLSMYKKESRSNIFTRQYRQKNTNNKDFSNKKKKSTRNNSILFIDIIDRQIQ
jgi:hypothetical protein